MASRPMPAERSMPELPEVETVRRSLIPRIVGCSIVDAHLGEFTGVVGDQSPDAFRAAVQRQRIIDIDRRGKYLSLLFESGAALVIHLRMTGVLMHVPRDSESIRFQHLSLQLDDGYDLRYADQRKFGRVLFLEDGPAGYLRSRLGPEPLRAEFSARYFGEVLHRRPAPIKGVLLDQRVVAGIGNIYADEALFRARIHPRRPASSLDALEIRRLHRAIRFVLRAAIERRGTTFSSFLDGEGRAGDNAANLFVYGRGSTESQCFRCHRPLAVIRVAGRSSHHCPSCQPRDGTSRPGA